MNFYIGSTATIELKHQKIELQQQTGYPWDGDVQLTVAPEKKLKAALHLRLPGWARNQPVPGDTYHYLQNDTTHFQLR